MRFQREVPGVYQVVLEIPQVPLVWLRTGRWEDFIVLAPDDQGRRLIFAQVILPRWMQRRVRAIAVKRLQLNFLVALAVKQPLDNLLLSNSVRAGVTGLAKTLANEFGKDNITVNNACPGYMLTDRLEEMSGVQALAEGISRQEIQARWAQNVPVRRLGKPEEFAAMVAFLCSERASYLSGVSIQIDGGLIKGLF